MFENEIWTPPLSSMDHKRLNRQEGHKWQKVAKWSSDKTLWDWLQLLAALAIPVVIAAGTLWFSAQQSESSSQASEKQHQTDLQIAKDQQEEAALQTYLDRMSDILLNSKLRESQPGDEVRTIAQARTLTVLLQLNGRRKGELVRFLHEAGLINTQKLIIDLSGADLSSALLRGAGLNGANFSGANLSGVDLREGSLMEANLSGANLSGADFSGVKLGEANLNGANLSEADLNGAILFGARLREASLRKASLRKAILLKADLREADLRKADLSDASLSGSDLRVADLSDSHLNEIDLMGADLREANLMGADLNGADLSFANLSGTKVTPEQLKQALSLEGSTMPDGSKHP